jgi:hypothetical protein
MDGITLMLQQWNSSSLFNSVEKGPHFRGSPSPPPTFSAPDYTQQNTSFFSSTTPSSSPTSTQSFAFTTPDPQHKPTSGVVYTIQPTTSPTNTTTSQPTNNQNPKNPPLIPENHKPPHETFNLAISRPKLDFPSYSGDDPYN